MGRGRADRVKLIVKFRDRCVVGRFEMILIEIGEDRWDYIKFSDADHDLGEGH